MKHIKSLAIVLSFITVIVLTGCNKEELVTYYDNAFIAEDVNEELPCNHLTQVENLLNNKNPEGLVELLNETDKQGYYDDIDWLNSPDYPYGSVDEEYVPNPELSPLLAAFDLFIYSNVGCDFILNGESAEYNIQPLSAVEGISNCRYEYYTSPEVLVILQFNSDDNLVNVEINHKIKCE